MTGYKSKKLMSDSRFGMVVEDPMYDEDGQLVDEDFDEIEAVDLDEVAEDLSPRDTYFGA